jgi:hypothetical protein
VIITCNFAFGLARQTLGGREGGGERERERESRSSNSSRVRYFIACNYKYVIRHHHHHHFEKNFYFTSDSVYADFLGHSLKCLL